MQKLIKRILLLSSLFILTSLSCSGNDILRTVRGALCDYTGGDWILIDDTTYYCERYSEEDTTTDTTENGSIANDEELAANMELLGDWHGPRCVDEDVGTFMYQWSVNLMQNKTTNRVVGTIKFHDCPGGGKALFYVDGFVGSDGIISLDGVKKTGGGALFNNFEEYKHFNFDPQSGQLLP